MFQPTLEEFFESTATVIGNDLIINIDALGFNTVGSLDPAQLVAYCLLRAAALQSEEEDNQLETTLPTASITNIEDEDKIRYRFDVSLYTSPTDLTPNSFKREV